jgi:hypothetical protein
MLPRLVKKNPAHLRMVRPSPADDTKAGPEAIERPASLGLSFHLMAPLSTSGGESKPQQTTRSFTV